MSKKDFILPVCSIETKKMKEVLNLCSMAVSKSHNDPYLLMHIRMSFNFKEKSINIQSTNINQGLFTNIQFDFKEDGIERDNFICCIPYKELAKISSVCYSEIMTFLFDNEILILEYGKSKYTIPIIVKDAKEFPVWKKVDDNAATISINDNKSGFCDYLKKLSHISGGQIGSASQFIDLSCKNGEVSMIGTDKYVISVIYFDLRCSLDFNSILIPKDSALFLSRLFEGDLIKLLVGNNFITVKSKEVETFVLLGKLNPLNTMSIVNGLINQESIDFITTKTMLTECLKSSSIVDDVCCVKFNESFVSFTSENTTLNQKSVVKIDCECENSDSEHYFLIRYFDSILDVIKGEDVKVSITNSVFNVIDINNDKFVTLFSKYKP